MERDKKYSKLSDFSKKEKGKILGFKDKFYTMPTKIIEMGLVPDTEFQILYQAPFGGPLYIEFGEERSKIALRISEAKNILVQKL